MIRFEWRTVKILWDEYRVTKQIRVGWWWLLTEPDPPGWFMRYELGLDEKDGCG